MQLISDLVDYLDGLPYLVRIAICLISVIVALSGAKIALINPRKDIVKTSSAARDDLLIGPLSIRFNIFLSLIHI